MTLYDTLYAIENNSLNQTNHGVITINTQEEQRKDTAKAKE